MAVTPTVPAANVSIYVGDLHPDVTEGQLFDAFTEFKSMTSVRVCRNSSTSKSLCYGYVNFTSGDDATLAIQTKNNSLLNGKVIRVMWSHRDQGARKSGIANVFVKNLDDSINNMGLQEMFQKFGNILSCKVALSEDGKSKCYGFVQFESEESANAAIEKLNGSNIGGKQIYAGKFVKKCDRVVPIPDAKYTNLYMKNLDPDVREEFLQEEFSKFGKIANLVISRDENGTSRGFGFVNFVNPDDASRAVEAMNGSQLGSKSVYVARAQKKAEREQILRRQFEEKRNEQIQKYKGSNVYVKNIDDDINDDNLRELFSQCGTITSAKVMRDEKAISKGFGFVCFSTPEEANKAVETFHGYMFHRKPLYVALAQRKEERQAQLQHQFTQQLAGLTGHSAAFIPAGYPPLYYPTTPSVMSQVPPGPGLMYQPLGLRPGWRAPPRPAFQPPPLPVIPNNPRQNRQYRGRMNGGVFAQSVGSYIPNLQHSAQVMASPKDLNNQQRIGQGRHMPNGRQRDTYRGPGVLAASPNSVGSGAAGLGTLSSMLAAASSEQQKQILGEQLFPLVQTQKPDLAGKITGMLLEMDNSELLLLLESPESLASKVEEADRVLKLSKTKASSNNESPRSNCVSAGVAVI